MGGACTPTGPVLVEHYTEGETEAQEGLTGTCVPSSPSPPQTPSIFTFSLQERTLLSPLAPPEMGQDQCGEGVGRWLETRNRNSRRLQGQGSPETTAPGLGIHRQVGATFAASPAWDHRLGASSGPGCVGTIRPISEVNPRRPEARKTAVGCGTGVPERLLGTQAPSPPRAQRALWSPALSVGAQPSHLRGCEHSCKHPRDAKLSRAPFFS